MKPTEEFWMTLGFGLMVFFILAGFALLQWAGGLQ